MADDTPAFDIADELAALNRMRLIEELEPAFYERHWQRVAYITAVVSGFANDNDELRLAMALCAESPHVDAAALIRQLLPRTSYAHERAVWFHDQMDAVLRSAFRLVREPDLPDWLDYAREVIEHAFVAAPPPQDDS